MREWVLRTNAALISRCWRARVSFLLAGLPALGLLTTPPATAQPVVHGPAGFRTLEGTSAGGGLTLTGTLTASMPDQGRGGTWVVTGDFGTVRSADAVSALVANGGFEDSRGTFLGDANGFMTLFPGSGGPNLLPYGDAEGLTATPADVTAAIPGWIIEGNLAVLAWNDPINAWLGPDAPGPADRGSNFFYGGIENQASRATVRVSFPAAPELIDAGAVEVELSGWFGGFLGQGDTASLALTFLDEQGADLGSFAIGPTTPDDRDNRTGMVFDRATRSLPSGTREAEAVLEIRRQTDNGWNDGIADSLRLALLRDGPGALAGWSVIEAPIRWVDATNTAGLRSPDGTRFLDLAADANTPTFGGVAQTVATLPGQAYLLRFALGTRLPAGEAPGPVSVEVTVDGVPHTFSFQPEGTGEAWKSFELPFTATTAATRLVWRGRSRGAGEYLGLDQVTLSPGVPDVDPVLEWVDRGGPAADTLELSFQSVTGKSYSLQSVDALTAVDWEIVPGTQRTGTGGRMTVSVPIQTSTTVRFFRLRTAP